MTTENKRLLLKLARDVISAHFDRRRIDLPDSAELQEKRGLFVTLHSQGELRGCIGYIRAYKSLAESVVEMAQTAAFRDNRFHPLRESELPNIQIEISVLSEMLPIADTSQIEIGRDGLFLQHPYGSGLLLPQVPVEWNWDIPTFLVQLCQKAGLQREAWKDEGAQLFRFSAEVFGEADFLA